MSKEMEAINAYILNQQNKINELNQQLLMLQTKNKLLEDELESVKSINRKYEEAINESKFKRDSLKAIKNESGDKERVIARKQPPKISVDGNLFKQQQENLRKR